MEKLIINSIACRYRGESDGEKKYGLQILPNWPTTLMIAIAQALFSGVWLTDEEPQLYTKAFAEKQPEM